MTVVQPDASTPDNDEIVRKSYLPYALTICAALIGCGSESDEPALEVSTLTYYGDAKAIIDARCATCHQPDDIGPFSLTTYQEVQNFAGAVRIAVEAGSMPPWKPSDDCNSYLGDFDLTAAEKDTLLEWIDAGAAEGDPADAPANPGPGSTTEFAVDLSLRLPEPYTPTREPDDYRCQLIPWPAQETRYVTGVRVAPDQRAIVHHVIVFVAGPDEVAQYQAYDAAEEGPGYTCYGGPTANDGGNGLGDIDPQTLLATLERLGISIADLRAGNITREQSAALISELGISLGGFQSIGSWVPGAPAMPFPAGTGIKVEPGSMLIAQMHYNTLSSAPTADQSTIEIATTDSVEREATILAAVDVGWVTNGLMGDAMTIPAGAEHVEHSTSIPFDSPFVDRARDVLGLPVDAPLIVHTANHHMHELGTSQRTELRHEDGSSTCLLDIPDWDFGWQGSYTLSTSIPFQSGDQLWMGCSWNNSAANQPVIDGVAREPVDVAWGEGTSDEMCLGAFYVTGQ